MTQAPKAIRGIGGVFLNANDPLALVAWYGRHLGLDFQCYAEGQCYGLEFNYSDPDGAAAHTVFSINLVKEPLPNPRREVVVNWRVADLDAFVAGLEAAGIVVEKSEDFSYGRFAWITDPEGNRLELYQMLDH